MIEWTEAEKNRTEKNWTQKQWGFLRELIHNTQKHVKRVADTRTRVTIGRLICSHPTLLLWRPMIIPPLSLASSLTSLHPPTHLHTQTDSRGAITPDLVTRVNADSAQRGQRQRQRVQMRVAQRRTPFEQQR